MKELLEDSSEWLNKHAPKAYADAKPKGFIWLVLVLVAAYVGLAVAEVPVPHGLDLLAGAVGGWSGGVSYARTFKPNGKR